jgi:polynucleotide 5'-hydroxyl-kinase GRC3/NOL9
MLHAPPDLTSLDVPDAWCDLADRLPDQGRIVLLGPVDSGKTSLAWWLAEELSSGGPTILVDADVGQSRVGPPASVGWLEYGGERGEFEFVGDVTPASRPAAALAAVATMTARAALSVKPRWTVVDTTGYVDGPGAGQLKTAKLQLLAPATVVAIAEPGRLDHLRWPWRGREAIRWLRLDPAAGCGRKSLEERQAWRRGLFADWLAGAEACGFDLDHLALREVPPPSQLARLGPDGLEGLLVGLDDARGIGLCVGLLETLDTAAGRAMVMTPPAGRAARGLRLGALRLNPDGSPREEDATWQDNT